MLWSGLIDHHISTPMGITGENLAEKYSITREQCDEFAVVSNKRWKHGMLHFFHSLSLIIITNFTNFIRARIVRKISQSFMSVLSAPSVSTLLHSL